MVALIEHKINNHFWNKLFHKSLFETIRFPENHFYEDIAIFHLILAKVETTVVISSPKYHYRQREDSIINNHSAKYLVDYAMAYINRFSFFENNEMILFKENKDMIQKSTAQAISFLWKWWFKCHSEKEIFKTEIKELLLFSKNHFTLFGDRRWFLSLRVFMPFMHSSSRVSFAISYFINFIIRKKQIKNRKNTNIIKKRKYQEFGYSNKND